MLLPALRRSGWAVTLGLLSVLFGACETGGGIGETDSADATAGTGSSTGSGDTDGSDPSEAAKLSRAYCARFFECGCPEVDPRRFAEGIPPATYRDQQECEAIETAALQAVLDRASEVGLTVDIDCIRRVRERFEMLGCDPDWSATGPRPLCKYNYGDKGEGQACTNFDGLVDGDDCAADLLCWSGVCQVPREAFSPGEECPFEHPYCDSDAVCLDLDDDGRRFCEPLPGEGEPCLLGTLCAPDMRCGEIMTCVPAPETGDPCAEATGTCGLCLLCDEATMTCVEPGQTAVGEPCRSDPECAQGSFCEPSTQECIEAAPYVCWGGATEVPPSAFNESFCE